MVLPNQIREPEKKLRARKRRRLFVSSILGASVVALAFSYAVRFQAHDDLLARIQPWDYGVGAGADVMPEKMAQEPVASPGEPADFVAETPPTGLVDSESAVGDVVAEETAGETLVVASADFGTFSSSGFTGTGAGGYGIAPGRGSGQGSGSGGLGGPGGGAYGPGGSPVVSAGRGPAGGAPAIGEGAPGGGGGKDTPIEKTDPTKDKPEKIVLNPLPGPGPKPKPRPIPRDPVPDPVDPLRPSPKPIKHPEAPHKPAPVSPPIQILDTCKVLNGTDTIQGDLVIAGCDVHSPGHSPGIQTVEGDYYLDGLLKIEIGGPDPGTGYDQLDVTGDAYLDGTIKVSLVRDYVPTLDDVFDIILAKNIFFGENFGIIFPELSGGHYWKYFLVQLEGGRWALRLVDPIHVPAPGALLVFAVGIAGLAGMRGFRRRA